MKIILPKQLVRLYGDEGPLFYLAGPVLGGDDWQMDACGELLRHYDHFVAAIPCRWGGAHPYKRHEVDKQFSLPFDRQTTWERHYMQEASMNGCLIFWLPTESKANPRSDGSPYARDTYGELGEWRGRLMYAEHQRVVVGADPNFLGRSQIERNFQLALRSPFTLHESLRATINAAVEKVRPEYPPRQK
jgi:hypothetical protein